MFDLPPVQARVLSSSRFRNVNRAQRRCVTMPERVGAHVKLIFGEMRRQHFTYDEVEEGSGVRRPTIKQWRRKNQPSLESLEAVLGFLGWSLVPVPAVQTLSPVLAGKTATLSAEFGLTMPETMAALIDIGVEQKLLRMDADERRAVIEARKAAKASVKRQYRRRKPANDNTPQAKSAKAA